MRRKQTETRAGYLRKSPRGMKRRPHTPARKGRQPRGFSVPTVPRCCSSKVMPETTIWALWLSGLSGCLIASSRGGPSDLYSLCRYGSGRFPPLPRAPPPCLTLVIGVPDFREVTSPCGFTIIQSRKPLRYPKRPLCNSRVPSLCFFVVVCPLLKAKRTVNGGTNDIVGFEQCIHILQLTSRILFEDNGPRLAGRLHRGQPLCGLSRTRPPPPRTVSSGHPVNVHR
ncbi:hypothetical protein M432DRAFT_404667 [Thermoascus aurantiacus ATCC 26904]